MICLNKSKKEHFLLIAIKNHTQLATGKNYVLREKYVIFFF